MPVISGRQLEGEVLTRKRRGEVVQLLATGASRCVLRAPVYQDLWMVPHEVQNCLLSPHFLHTPKFVALISQ